MQKHLLIFVLIVVSGCCSFPEKVEMACKNGGKQSVLLSERAIKQSGYKFIIQGVEIPIQNEKIKVGNLEVSSQVFYTASDIAQIFDNSQYQASLQLAGLACSDNESLIVEMNKKILEERSKITGLTVILSKTYSDEKKLNDALQKWINLYTNETFALVNSEEKAIEEGKSDRGRSFIDNDSTKRFLQYFNSIKIK